jgi:hypothetical protein
MSSDLNFSELWKGQSAPVPDVAELIGKAKALKNKARNRQIGLSILLLGTAAFITWIWIYYQPQLLTTRLGICLVLAAIAMIVAYHAGSLKLLLKKNSDSSTTSYLKELIRLKHKQEYLQKVIMSIYFVMLSVGLALYMIEYTLPMEKWMALAVYGVTAAWILFNWFYLRPRTIRKQQEEVNRLIAEFERIDKQFTE